MDSATRSRGRPSAQYDRTRKPWITSRSSRPGSVLIAYSPRVHSWIIAHSDPTAARKGSAAGRRSWILRRPPGAEVDRPVAARLQLADEVVHRADRRVELRRADADEADEVRVAAAVRGVAVTADEVRHPRVLALPAPAVQRLDGDDALERRLRLVVRAETDRRPAGMTRQRDSAQAIDLAHQLLRGEAHVPKVEARDDVAVHAVDEHVAVVGLDLGGVQDEDAVAVLERAVVARGIELTMLREHDAVERTLRALPLEELQVRLDGRTAVVGQLRVEMEVEDHGAGRNLGSVTSGVTSSNTTSTAMPIRTASGAQPTTFVMRRGPSSSSTIASTYGSSSRKPGAWFWRVIVNV